MRGFGYIIFELKDPCIFLQVLADLNPEWPQCQQEEPGEKKTNLRRALTGPEAWTTFSILPTQNMMGAN